MKKLIHIVCIAVLCTSCNLGTLNYPASRDLYILNDVAGRMAYDGLSIPVQIIHSLQESEDDIFSPGFSKTVSFRYQTMKMSLNPDTDCSWTFETLSAEDNIVVSMTIQLMPLEDPKFRTWMAWGECDYFEGGGYKAVLEFRNPVGYSWIEKFDEEGSNYTKSLSVTGEGLFTTGDDSDIILDKGIFQMKDSEISSTKYGYCINGTVKLENNN